MDFGPTLKHLQAFFAPRKVVAKVYQSPELEKAVEQGKIDFFFCKLRILLSDATIRGPRPSHDCDCGQN